MILDSNVMSWTPGEQDGDAGAMMVSSYFLTDELGDEEERYSYCVFLVSNDNFSVDNFNSLWSLTRFYGFIAGFY